MTLIRMRRGLESEWNEANPVLASGEIGYAYDVERLKIGDGSSEWGSLNYLLDERYLLPATTTEQIQDAAAPLLAHNGHTNITFTYDDANNRLVAVASGGGSNMDDNYILDLVGTLLNNANNSSLVTVGYAASPNNLTITTNFENFIMLLDQVILDDPYNIITAVVEYDAESAPLGVRLSINETALSDMIVATGLKNDDVKAVVAEMVANGSAQNDIVRVLLDEDDNPKGIFADPNAIASYLTYNILSGDNNGVDVGFDPEEKTFSFNIGNRAPSFLFDRTKNYNFTTHLYNTDELATKKIRHLLAEAAVGTSLVPFNWMGDSIRAGHKAVPGVTDPTTLLRKLLIQEGYPVTGGWVYPANGTTRDSRWSITGTWSDAASTVSNFLDTVQNGATATFVETLPGTVVEFSVFSTSNTTITYTIDGSAPVTYNVTANAIRKVQVTGLIDTTHTLVITNTGTPRLWIGPARTRRTTGLSLTNAGIFGSLATDWLSTAVSSAWFNPYNIMMTLEVPKLVVVGLGANEMINVPAATPTSLRSTLTTLGNSITTAGSALMYQSYPPSIAESKLSGHTNVDHRVMTPWLLALFGVASDKNVPMIDHYLDYGTQADYKAAGLGWTDDIHPLDRGYMAMARREAAIFRSLS